MKLPAPIARTANTLAAANPAAYLLAGGVWLVAMALWFAGAPAWIWQGLNLGAILAALVFWVLAKVEGSRRARFAAELRTAPRHFVDPWGQHGPGFCVEGADCPQYRPHV